MSGNRGMQTKWKIGIRKVHKKPTWRRFIFLKGLSYVALRKEDSRREFPDGDK